MTNEDINIFRKIIREELKPVNNKLDKHTTILKSHGEKLDEHTAILNSHSKILKSHGEKLDEHTTILKSHSKILKSHGEKLDALWDQMIEVTGGMEEMKEILASHSKLLKRIELAVENNSENIKRLSTRMRIVEDRTGIIPPIELSIID